jgi:hypothetical protein
MDIMKNVGDPRDERVRLEAFKSIAALSEALLRFRDRVIEDEWRIEEAKALVEAAKSAVVYLADDIRSPIDRALGIIDAEQELNEHFSGRFRSDAARDELQYMVATMILRDLVGIPAKRVWRSCAQCGTAAREVGPTYKIAVGEVCARCWLDDYNAREAANKTSPPTQPTIAFAPLPAGATIDDSEEVPF